MLISEELRKMSIANDKCVAEMEDSFCQVSVNLFCSQFHCFKSFFFLCPLNLLYTPIAYFSNQEWLNRYMLWRSPKHIHN